MMCSEIKKRLLEISGSVIAETQFEKPDDQVFFLTGVETMGIPAFLITEEDADKRPETTAVSGRLLCPNI